MLIIIGPTCSGKDTITASLIDSFGYNRILEHTTRERREGEENGKQYWFNTDEEFKALVDKNQLVGVRKFNRFQNGVNTDVFYGTDVNALLADSPNNVLTTNIGAAKMLKEYAYNADVPLYIVLLNVDQQVQMNRLRMRGDEEEEIIKRVETDAKAYSADTDIADMVVDNDGSVCATIIASEIDHLYKEWYDRL